MEKILLFGVAWWKGDSRLPFSHCATAQKRYHVSRENEARGSTGLLHKEKHMSREDDFDDIMDSSDEMDAGHEDTSEPLLDESPADEVDVVVTGILLQETDEDELAVPPQRPRPAPKPKTAKKVAKKTAKKQIVKKKTAASKPKVKPRKKAAKVTRRPPARKTTAKKKTAKKTAKKPVAKKKRAGKARRKR
jgi:hypothetical protein